MLFTDKTSPIFALIRSFRQTEPSRQRTGGATKHTRQQSCGITGHWPRPLCPTAAGIAQGSAKIRSPTHLAGSVINWSPARKNSSDPSAAAPVAAHPW